MSSIDPQIDAFVPKMKAAAARHDGDWTMDGYPHTKDGVLRFISRACRNLDEAYVAVLDGEDPSEPLCDAANLCALSYSIKPADTCPGPHAIIPDDWHLCIGDRGAWPSIIDTPNPGSPEALRRGCTCPVVDNGHGMGFPYPRTDGRDPKDFHSFWVNGECPVHGQEKV